MKKIIKISIIFILCACLLLAITACGNKEENKEESKKEETVTQAKDFSLGNWDGKVYKNDFLGLQYNEPEGWTHSTDEEIAEMMNMGKELLNDDQKKALEASKASNVYYLVSKSDETGENLSITSEKVDADYTVDFFINSVRAQLTAVESIKYEILGTEKAKVGKVDCDVLKTKGTYLGVELYQNYYIFKIDNYFVSIIATSTSGASTIDAMISNFK